MLHYLHNTCFHIKGHVFLYLYVSLYINWISSVICIFSQILRGRLFPELHLISKSSWICSCMSAFYFFFSLNVWKLKYIYKRRCWLAVYITNVISLYSKLKLPIWTSVYFLCFVFCPALVLAKNKMQFLDLSPEYTKS